MTEHMTQFIHTQNALNQCGCSAFDVFGATPRTSLTVNKVPLTVALISMLRGFIVAFAGEVYPNTGDTSALFREAELSIRKEIIA